jgi:nucleotide-binding universal stress UspA family protein
MTSKIKKILCAMDLSDNSELVLLSALREADAHNGSVYILHINPSFDSTMTMPIVSFMGEERFTELIEEKKVDTKALISRKIDKITKQVLKSDKKISADRIKKIHVYEGHPVVEILNMCSILKADMLVMGTHGKGIMVHTFLGSVVRKVIKRTTIPVLLVPAVANPSKSKK